MIEPSYVRVARAAYDAMAGDYVDFARHSLAGKPFERAMLATYAELVRTSDLPGPVVEAGCGTGRITAHLHALGLDVSGVDLSPGMIAVARQEHPHIRFEEGRLAALDIADESLSGVVAWYSIIHTPPEDHPAVLAEFHRVLAPGGHLLLAFQVGQVGDEPFHLAEAFGHQVGLDFHRVSPDHLTRLLADAGIPVIARLLCERGESERTPQAYLVARKPVAAAGPPSGS
ncbi:class I SAM-dependent methyltransferase [Microbispora sp. H10949]|uniref:class I SAM-dependent methyltransferase n=1 Tax=Microbispora sp. H10949 TaxID=2729111 RepID=UPI0015FF5743|nr:class I SAM-dependent methyltransferase [Microbispora sp. H10949]